MVDTSCYHDTADGHRICHLAGLAIHEAEESGQREEEKTDSAYLSSYRQIRRVVLHTGL